MRPEGASKGEGDSMAYVYVLRCADGSFYTGSTKRELEARINEHQSGLIEGYTRAQAG